MSTVRIGIKLPSWGSLASSDSLTPVATLAEARGYDSVWVSDHVVMPVNPANTYPFSEDGRPPFDPRTPFQDPFVALAFVASITKRVQLGIGVLVLGLRHPIAVAKQAATLDVLSKGRLVLGIGTGWMREEFELLGQEFDGRGRRTDEAIATLRACWDDDPINLGPAAEQHGPVAMNPKPVRGVAVPVLIGGHGKRALQRAAQIGDGWYASNVDPVRFEVLAREVRRERALVQPDSEFQIGIKVPVVDAGRAAQLEKEYIAAGADFVVFDMNFDHIAATEATDLVNRIADQLSLDERGRTGGSI